MPYLTASRVALSSVLMPGAVGSSSKLRHTTYIAAYLLPRLTRQDQLRLGDDGHAAVLGIPDRRLPHHGAATHVQRRRLANEKRAAAGGQEIGLRLDGRGQHVGRQIENRGDRAQGVG